MSALNVSAETLAQMASQGTLADRVAEHVSMNGSRVGRTEKNSWSSSLAALGRDLLDAGLSEVEVIIEYKLPLTSRRIDVLLAGQHPATGADSYLVVELKQWSRAYSFEGSSTLVEVDHVPRPLLHPVVQVSGYCEYLTDFLAVLAGAPDRIRGVAYLHNATDEGIRDLRDLPHGQQFPFPMFTGQHRTAFLDYLRDVLAPKPGIEAAKRLLASPVRPSTHLLSHAADVLTQREHFPLLDEQRIAYELVLHKVEQARAQDSKSIIMVAGGPGNGKSVIALSVLAEMARQGYPVLHATGSNSFTESMRKYAGRGSSRLKEMFKYFNFFVDAHRNGIEVLVCDEAHRIRKNSLTRYMTREVRARAAGRLQLDELIAAARVPVFLLDEHQVVRPGETGTVDIIRSRANELGLDVEFVPLHGQFRCGGSEVYEQWVIDLLGLDDGQPFVWEGDGRFDLQLADSPDEMVTFLDERHKSGATARISAGFCWPWSKPRPDGSLVDDVQIGNWRRPWNANSERSIGGAPGKAYWATDPAGFGQVGCVYTAQGFEYDWSGVIIGPDLVARAGRLLTRRSESKDPELKGKKATDEQADQLIRNTYKVLLTRGMRGTIIYSTDGETREYLRALVHQRRAPETRYQQVAPGVFERTGQAVEAGTTVTDSDGTAIVDVHRCRPPTPPPMPASGAGTA